MTQVIVQSVKIKFPSEARLRAQKQMLNPQNLMADVNRLSATIKPTRWNRQREWARERDRVSDVRLQRGGEVNEKNEHSSVSCSHLSTLLPLSDFLTISFPPQGPSAYMCVNWWPLSSSLMIMMILIISGSACDEIIIDRQQREYISLPHIEHMRFSNLDNYSKMRRLRPFACLDRTRHY